MPLREQKELSGIMFRNDKGDNPSRPDYRGAAKIGGVNYTVSGWIKQGSQAKFLSLAFTESSAPADPETDIPADTEDLPPF